jgi:hypothetical protein
MEKGAGSILQHPRALTQLPPGSAKLHTVVRLDDQLRLRIVEMIVPLLLLWLGGPKADGSFACFDLRPRHDGWLLLARR